MSGVSNADSLHPLTVDASLPPIPKDMQGPDSSFPLSPQWLLPKLGDNKLVQGTRENHTDPLKSLENVEDHNVVKKRKDVFRPYFYDTEKVRHESWADEERDANSAIRRDLQKEGEEFVDYRKLERWSNNSSRYSNESRHFQSERWSGSGSRESAYEPRRESKWNTRWGPDDKESENSREKWPGKDGDSSYNKGSHHQTTHAKDIKSQGKDTDKEGEHSSRSWRSSVVVKRGRGEAGTYLPSVTNKPASMFGYGEAYDIGYALYGRDDIPALQQTDTTTLFHLGARALLRSFNLFHQAGQNFQDERAAREKLAAEAEESAQLEMEYASRISMLEAELADIRESLGEALKRIGDLEDRLQATGEASTSGGKHIWVATEDLMKMRMEVAQETIRFVLGEMKRGGHVRPESMHITPADLPELFADRPVSPQRALPPRPGEEGYGEEEEDGGDEDDDDDDDDDSGDQDERGDGDG